MNLVTDLHGMEFMSCWRRTVTIGVLGWVLGCQTEPEDDSGAAEGSGEESGSEEGGDDPSVVTLPPMEHLIRASMAIRGVRPSLADLALVEQDPAQLQLLVDQYLDDPRFGATIRALHNEALLVEPDYAYFPAGFPAIGALAGKDFYAINRSIMEAPLRLVEHVVMSDRPYSEIVTANYTVADPTVATVWGLAHSGAPDEWVVTAWTDGRENAGILSDSWLYQRHQSTDVNANRGRANAIASALLCADFLSIDIEIDASVDLADPNAVSQAVLDNPSCASCHLQLDPLASYFRGFFPAYVPALLCTGDQPCDYPLPYSWVQDLFPLYLGVEMQPPAYFGNAGDGLPFLGQQIAEDPRFARCTVSRFYRYLTQTELREVPDEVEQPLTDAFVASGMDAKALVKQIVLGDAFRTSHVVPADPAQPSEGELANASAGVLKARPLALAQMMEDLTGFRWVTNLNGIDDGAGGLLQLGRVPLLEDSFLGYRVLGGDIDANYVTEPAHTYTGPTFLVLEILAREAAHHVVEQDFARPAAERKLLSLVEPSEQGEAAIVAQLTALHLRLYGQHIGTADTQALWNLWSGLHRLGNDPARAWKGTLSAMFSDIRVAYY